MAVAPTYPGVYVEEVPSGVNPIAGVPTAIAAFIGWFPMGPMNSATAVLSFADVERQFGGLSRNSDTSFALSQYFLNGGGRAWVVRVAGPGSGSTALAAASTTVSTASAGAFVATAINEGSWGNAIRVQVAGPYGTTPERFDLTVSVVGTSGGRATITQQEVYRGLTATDANDPNYVITAVNGISSLITIGPPSSGALATPIGSGVVSGASVPMLTSTTPHQLSITLGGQAEVVTIPGTISTLQEIAADLQSAIRTARGFDPTWSQATVQALAGSASGDTGRLQILSGLADASTISVADVPLSNSNTDTSATFLKLTTAASSQNGAVALTGGGDGDHPGATDIAGSQSAGTGMYALENTDFTLLCLPSIANQLASDVDGLAAAQYSTVVGNAIAYCRTKRAMLLLDPPDTIGKPATMQGWINANSSVRDDYTALYYPRTSVADPTNNYLLRSIGPCGTIAGLMARIDASRGVWKAPAGTEATLTGLAQLDYDLTDAENGTLNPIAVNCLRAFDTYGLVCWGARTLNGSDGTSSDYRYVPVRRLANFLESSLYIGLKWVVFEPNDEPLWSQIRVNVQSFMQGLFLQGAFAGMTPKDAYLVKCDSTTTSPTDQQLGIVNVLVGFAPVRPAEFVILRIQQLAGQTQG
jgi:uncharacterized protein